MTGDWIVRLETDDGYRTQYLQSGVSMAVDRLNTVVEEYGDDLKSVELGMVIEGEELAALVNSGSVNGED